MPVRQAAVPCQWKGKLLGFSLLPQEVHLGDSPILSGLPKALSGTGVESLTLHLSSVMALGPHPLRLPSLGRLQIGLRRILPPSHQHAFHSISPSQVAEAAGRIARLFQPLPPTLRCMGGSAEDYAAVLEGLPPGLPPPQFGEAVQPAASTDESEQDSSSASEPSDEE